MTEETIRRALRDCFDPEFRLNVIELNKVQELELAVDPEAPGSGIAGVPARYSVTVILLRGDRDEAVDAQLAAVIHNRLAGFFELSRIQVRFASEPLWTISNISAGGRRILGLDTPVFPILNNRVR